jgi:sec-independent protein translocase protein TatA
MPALPSVGPWEILLVLLVAVVIFGPRRLPELGRGMGRGVRELKEGLKVPGVGAGRDED